jgi:hypothetical protein
MEMRLIHKGKRIHATVEYFFERPVLAEATIVSVMHEGKDILAELAEREVEQLESHLEELKKADALDQMEDV